MLNSRILLKNIQPHFFLYPTKFLYLRPICSFSNSDTPNNTNERQENKPKFNLIEKFRNKTRINRSNIARIYEISKKMNILRYFRKEIDEQKLVDFLQKVQRFTLLGIYEAVSFSYLFNYLDIFRQNLLYACGGGLGVAFASLYFLQKYNSSNHKNNLLKFLLYQGIIISLSMSFTPALSLISNPVLIPAIYVISAASYFTSQVTNAYFAKQRYVLPVVTFVGGVCGGFLTLYAISYSAFVAVGNNPFVGAYSNFWVKNEIYMINAIFALNANNAIKNFKRGDMNSMAIALNFYLNFVKRIASLLSYILGKLKN